jgi:hypothetical protein
MTEEKSRRVVPRSAASTSTNFRVHPDHDPSNRLDGVRRLTPFAETGELVECIVQNGRTVLCPAPGGEKRIAGFDSTKGEYTYCLVEQSFGPGQKIMLRESEARRLRDLNFVCWPDEFVELPPQKDDDVRRIGPEPARKAW